MRAKTRLEGHQALGSLDVMELKKSPKKWLQNTATKLSFGNLEHFLFILGTVPFNFASFFRRYLWMYHVPVQFYEKGIQFFSLKRTQTGCVSFCYIFFFNSFDGYQSLIKSIGLAIINLQLYNWSCWPSGKIIILSSLSLASSQTHQAVSTILCWWTNIITNHFDC